MPWCPTCGAEYESGVARCADCDADLVDERPAENTTVVVMEARSVTEAQVAQATLGAEGIEAMVQNIASASPNVGVMGDDVPELEVVVASEDAARAVAVLNETPVTDDELTEIVDANPASTQGDANV